MYLLTEEYVLAGKGDNFNAILYKALKKEIEGIICEIPIEELRKNKSALSSMDTFQFKMFLISLKSRCRAMRR